MSDYQKDPLLDDKREATIAAHWRGWRNKMVADGQGHRVCDYSLSQCNCPRLHYR